VTEATQRSAAKGTLWLGAVNLLSKGAQMVLTIVLAHFLDASQLGLIALAVSVVTIGQIIQSMGIYDVIARTDRDPALMAGTILTFSVAISSALAVIGLVFTEQIAGLLGAPEAAPLVRIVVLSLPFTAIGGVQLGLMHREMEFHRRMLPDVGSAIVGAGLAITLAVLGVGELSQPIGLLVGAMLQPVLSVVAGVRVWFRWDRDTAVEALRWIYVVGPAALFSILLFNTGYVAVGSMLGAEQTGIYALAFRISWVPYLVVTAVLGAVAFPLYTRIQRESGVGALPEAVERMTHATVTVGGGVCLLLGLLAPRVAVIDPQWAPSATVLAFLCGYGAAVSIIEPWYSAIRAVGRPHWYLILQASQFVILVTLLIAFLRRGVVWAGISHLIAAWVIVPVLWVVLRRAAVAPALGRLLVTLRGPLAAGAAAFLVHLGFASVPAIADPESLAAGMLEGVTLLIVFGGVLLLVDPWVRGQARTQIARLRGAASDPGVEPREPVPDTTTS
jgi:O-antigen/teichoic acid export membrane protein